MNYGTRIVVVAHGFVYVGKCQWEHDGSPSPVLNISAGHCIRQWGTVSGLGELATRGPTQKTELDRVLQVIVPFDKVILSLPVSDDVMRFFDAHKNP